MPPDAGHAAKHGRPSAEPVESGSGRVTIRLYGATCSIRIVEIAQAIVLSAQRKDLFNCSVVVFRSRQAVQIRLLQWNGTVLVLDYKGLEDVTFTGCAIKDRLEQLTHAQFKARFADWDWGRVKAGETRTSAAQNEKPNTT